MMEVEIPITYESSDVNKLFEIYIEKVFDPSINEYQTAKKQFFDIFKHTLDVKKGKIEFKGKYIFQLTKGE